MTFEEAFNSGCRFKLPENYIRYGTWGGDWYWQKYDALHISTPKDNNPYLVSELKEQFPEYFKSEKWYLHPEDERVYRFNKMLENLE